MRRHVRDLHDDSCDDELTITNVDHRPEERWHQSLDNLAREFRDNAATMSELQDRAGYTARMKHIIFGLPAPIIAVLVTCLSGLWDSPDAKYVVAPLAAFGGVFSTVHTFFDMSGKAQRHWSYSALYGALVAKIDSTLARDIHFRIPPDAFFAEVRTEMTNLNGSAPQLGGKGVCGCTKYENPPSLPAPTRSGSFHYQMAQV